MPPKIPIPKVPAFARPIQQRASCQRPCIKTPRCPPSSQARCLSTYSPKYEDMEVDQGERPRWQTTPHNMAAPIRSRPKPRTSEFKVNDDPRRLDQMYIQLLGNGGDKMLTEEVKWLAVTHKSFDHGRRGFNDRLTFMGKQLMDVQTSLALIDHAPASSLPPTEDPYGRLPFHHSALDGLQNLTLAARTPMVEKRRMSQLAQRYGLGSVIRWKPKKPENLAGSGLELVLAQALYAVVGAIALQKGGASATKVAQERILRPLGLL